MKFSATILALIFSTLVASNGLSFFGGGQKVLDDKGDPVPGESPLTFCKPNHDDDILTLDYVNLSPNPPTAGNTLTIKAAGILLEPLEDGAYVVLQVKYGFIKLVNAKRDLCEQVSNVDLECPIDEGKITIVKDVELPDGIPPGIYDVFADVYTKDGRKVICLEAKVQF